MRRIAEKRLAKARDEQQQAVRKYVQLVLQNNVLERLVDPDSAKLRNLQLFLTHGLRDYTLCGELNARNKFGGYIGYNRFYSTGFLTSKNELETVWARIDEYDEDAPAGDGGVIHQGFLKQYAKYCKDGGW